MAVSGKIAEAFVDIKTNTEDYKKGISGVKSSLKTVGIAAAVAFSAKKIFDFGKSAVQIANDFGETRARFGTIFQGIGADADAAAKEIAESFDLASGTAKTMLANTGDLLTGFGFTKEEALALSTEVAKLGGDLASWSNIAGGAEEASKRITSAMLGETEATKALGVKIDQQSKGFRDQVKALKAAEGMTEAQAKAQVILKQITEQSTNALGDYARTQDSFANQQRALNEMTKELKDTVGTAIVKFIEMSGVLPKVINFIKGLNDKIADLTEGGKVEEWAIKTKAAMKKIWIALKTPWIAIGTLIGSALSAATAHLQLFWMSVQETFGKVVDEVKKAELEAALVNPIDAATKEFEKAADAWVAVDKKKTEELKKHADELGKKQKEEGKIAGDVRKKVVEEEKKKKAARFGTAESLLQMVQQGASTAAAVAAGAAGAGAVAAAGGGAKAKTVQNAAKNTEETKGILKEMLHELKFGNRMLGRIEKNTSNMAVFA